MKIYYDNTKYTQEEIIDKAMVRLLHEGNSGEDIKAWITRKPVEFANLKEYVNDTGCDTLTQMLADNEVSYVVTELDSDDDNFVYVGAS